MSHDEILLVGGILDGTIVAGNTKVQTVDDDRFDWASIVYISSGKRDARGRLIFEPEADE